MNSDYPNKMQGPNDMYRDYYDWNDRTYPEIYSMISPYINKAMEGFGDYRNLNDEEINMLTEKIMAESKIMSNPPERHNRETIFDFIKLLLIKEMEEMVGQGDFAVPVIGPYKYYPYPYSYPYYDDWWFPFIFGDRHWHRDFDRDHRDGRGYRRY